MTSNLSYFKGDATQHDGSPKIIAHVVNNLGIHGAGFTHYLEAAYPGVMAKYKSAHRVLGENGCLGHTILHPQAENLWIAHMFAQTGLPSRLNPVPFSYWAFSLCCDNLKQRINSGPLPKLIQMPKVGSGLARGDWETISQILLDKFEGTDIMIRVYIP